MGHTHVRFTSETTISQDTEMSPSRCLLFSIENSSSSGLVLPGLLNLWCPRGSPLLNPLFDLQPLLTVSGCASASLLPPFLAGLKAPPLIPFTKLALFPQQFGDSPTAYAKPLVKPVSNLGIRSCFCIAIFEVRFPAKRYPYTSAP